MVIIVCKLICGSFICVQIGHKIAPVYPLLVKAGVFHQGELLILVDKLFFQKSDSMLHYIDEKGVELM